MAAGLAVWLGWAAQAGAVRDTVVMRMVPPAPSAMQEALMIAAIAGVLLAYAALGAAIWAALRLHRGVVDAKASLDEVGKNLRDLTEHASKIAQNVEDVSSTVRTDIAAVHDTVDYVNRRTRHAVTQLADRVDSFNDALESVQQDTQSAIVTAVAVLKGVRTAMGGLRRRSAAADEPDDEEPMLDAGDEDDYDTPDLPERPRLRRRRRSGGST